MSKSEQLAKESEDLKFALISSRGITHDAKYLDVSEITSKLLDLAEDYNLLEEMEEALDNVREHINKLQSAIFQCEDVFEDAYKESILTFDEWKESTDIIFEDWEKQS